MLFVQTPFYQRLGALFMFSKRDTFEIQDKYSLLLGLFASVVLLTAGCAIGKMGQSTPHRSTKEEAPKQLEPINISLFIPADYTDEEIQRAFIEPFKKRYPHIALEVVKSGGGKNSMEDLLAAGTFPDLIYTSNPDIPKFKAVNLMTDLNDLVKKHGMDLNLFDKTVMDAIKMYGNNGQLLGIPYAQNASALIYNKDLFDKFAVPYPKDNMTWDDVYVLARSLTRIQDGISYIGIDPGSIWFVASGMSLPFVDPKTNKSVIDNEPWRNVFSMMQKFYEIPGFVGKNNKINYGAGGFTTERTMAMYPIWASSIQTGRSQLVNMNWDLVSLPNFPGFVGKGREVDVHLLAVSSSSKHKDEAFQFIKVATSEEVQTDISRNGRISVLANPDIQKQFGADVPEYKGKAMDALFKTKPSPLHQVTDYDKLVRDLIEKEKIKLASGMDVNTFARAVKEQADKAIEAELRK
jgi:multiple sugar transport system substrate-binding protein